MLKLNRTYLLASSLLALTLISKVQAEETNADWGNLGYAHPVEVKTPPPVKKVAAEDQGDQDEIATTISSAEMMNINTGAQATTVQESYDVKSEEKRTVPFYAAPFAGASAVVGADTVSSSPRYSAGVTVGALVTNKILVQMTYVHAESNLSNPTINNTNVALGGNSMLQSANSIGGGGRYFILGRDSIVRPFAGAGLGFERSSLNYSGSYASALDAQSSLYSNGVTLNQFNGYGEVGAEVAITRSIVGTLNFQLNGVLSSSVTSDSTIDGTRAAIANSIGRSTSYTAGAGLGIYF